MGPKLEFGILTILQFDFLKNVKANKVNSFTERKKTKTKKVN